MLEYGRIVGPNGQSYVAQGAAVHRRHVVGYWQPGKCSWHPSRLTTWHGQTMLECRIVEIAEWRSPDDFGDKRHVIAFRLTQGRAIVGLALGEGMLFRGELVDGIEDDDDLRAAAIAEAEHWQQVDWEDWQDQEAEREAEFAEA